ncbi:type II toxin-antitoxin system RatA family toxin [Pseudomonas stutzeri]|nr:type II toxin-antitoxin system RatA family toxin [Stutzerimonas stutzeri]
MSTHIQRSALLPYPAQALYELVNDVASYPQFLPWCSAAEVLESGPAHMRATLKVGKAGISQQFTTRNTLVPGESIEMKLEQGPFSALYGLWQFQALGDSACKITLDLTFDYSGALVKATLGPLFNQAATTMVDAFCQRAKQLYG